MNLKIECFHVGSWVETMKIAMNLTTTVFTGPPRAPLKLLSRENIESMAKGLSEVGLPIHRNNLNNVLKMH